MNRLKELRKAKKISQNTLSKLLDVSEKTISRWENGESQIKNDKAEKLAEFFDVTIGYLLGYSESPNIDYLFEDKDGTKNYVTSEEFMKTATQLLEYRKKLANYDLKSNLKFIKLLNQNQYYETKKWLDAILGKIENEKISKNDLKTFSEFVEWINNLENSKNDIFERINVIEDLIN